MNKIRLNLGCGIHIKKDFVNVDLYEESDLKSKKGIFRSVKWDRGAKYVKADIRKMPFKDNYANYVEMFEVLEHLPMRDVVPALVEIRRVMKPGAKFVMTSPNFDGLMKDWLEVMTGKFDPNIYFQVMETIYGNQQAFEEYHRVALNPQFLNWCLLTAGFKKGTLTLVPKHKPIPPIGSQKFPKGSVTRNEVLIAEVEK